MYKNIANQKIVIYAHNTLTDKPETGDSENIIAYIAKDAGSIAQSNDLHPTELDGTNMKGLYVFDLIQEESNADVVILSAISTTTNVNIEPVIIHTQTTMRGTDGANTIVPDAAGVLPTVDKIHDEVVEGTVTFRQAIKLLLSILTGKSSGGGTNKLTFRDIGDTKDRLKVTVDSYGNRTSIEKRDGT